MKTLRPWVALVFAACAATWPRPNSGSEWQATWRACRDGNQAACYWKARDEEPAKRRALYQTACDANVGRACNELGFFIARDGGGARAMELWKRACELGSKDGCDSLGTGWRDGVGGTVDARAALDAYERACRMHDATGCTNLGRQLLASDPARAEKLWREVCASEEISDACRLLGIARVHGEGLARDVDEGLSLLRRACRLGDADDCLATGEVLEELHQPGESLRYVRTSCTWGSAAGCLKLSRTLRLGEPDDEALREARDAELFACAHGACDAGVP